MTERACEFCGGGMEGKRSHARFCGRSCKMKAHYYETPIEKHRDKDRARYRKHRERRKAAVLAYAKRHPEKSAARKRTRRARKASAETFAISERDWSRMLQRYRHACAYCGERGPLHADHVIPLARGGRHGIGNLLPACASCNCSKNDKYLAEWRVLREGDHYDRRLPARRLYSDSRLAGRRMD